MKFENKTPQKELGEGTEGSGAAMPDVASQSKTQTYPLLDMVGMSAIETPVMLKSQDGVMVRTSARADAYVNLVDSSAKGIHMSRLFLELGEKLPSRELNGALIKEILENFIETHKGLSDSAFLRLSFEDMVLRDALRSEYKGWRTYPVFLSARLDKGQLKLEMGVEVLYSSTCPCSAALARQLIQDQFKEDFPVDKTLSYEQVLAWLGSEKGIVATPHSQRSKAEVLVDLGDQVDSLDWIKLVDQIEGVLKTAVQAAVKRPDEQEFSLLNGQNLMFCEDAARRIHTVLDGQSEIKDFWVKCTHMESLHPHDAVSATSKGIKGGYQAKF